VTIVTGTYFVVTYFDNELHLVISVCAVN